jgi:hypothetical protein
MDEREIEAVQRVLEAADLHLVMRMDSMPLEGAPAREVAEDIVAELDRVRDARGDDENHEGCERRGGVCDCAGRPCAIDYPDAARWERTAKAATAALSEAEDRIAELEAARSPQDEDHEHTWSRLNGRKWCTSCGADGGPWPQDEDHEAGELAKLAALAERDPCDVEAVRAYNDECKRISAQGEAIEAFKRAWNPAPLLASDERIARAIAAYLARVSPSRVGSVAVEDVLSTGACLEAARQAVESMRSPHDRFPTSGAIALAALTAALAEFSRSSTDRPEQHEPDVLGGQPPAEPETTGNG